MPGMSEHLKNKLERIRKANRYQIKQAKAPKIVCYTMKPPARLMQERCKNPLKLIQDLMLIEDL